jgi:ABC transporter DrrB family efflux protein
VSVVARPAAPAVGPGNSVAQAIGDGLVVAGRNLKRIPRIPELAIFAVIQSIMFVLLFTFVFGGAIPLPGGGSYVDFLLPGIMVQTVMFATAMTAVGMTDDIAKGIVDRFRSLPMARSAVLSGRAFSDIVYIAGQLIVLMLTGLAIGWRVHTNLADFLLGVALLLLFAFAMSWVGVWLGLTVPTVEVANQVTFTVIFPLTFVSNIFVPLETLPVWLQPVAEWNPASVLTYTVRQLWGDPSAAVAHGVVSAHPVLVTVAWVAIILAVFCPLGVLRYRSMSR